MQISLAIFLIRIVLTIGALASLVFFLSADAVSPKDFGLREGDLIRAVNDPDILETARTATQKFTQWK